MKKQSDEMMRETVGDHRQINHKLNSNKTAGRFRMEHWQIVALYLMLYDVLAVNAAYFMGLWLRFDCRYSMIPYNYLYSYLKFIPIYSVCCVGVFWALRLYKSLWRFASYSELSRVILSSIVTFVIHTAGITLLFGRMPLSYYFFGPIIQFILIIGVRFS